VIENPLINAVHVALLPGDANLSAEEAEILAAARDKLARTRGRLAAARLTPQEQMAILFDSPTLVALQRAYFEERCEEAA